MAAPVENLFQYRGPPGHEIVVIFDATFANRRLYAEQTLPFREPGWSGSVRWLSLEDPLPAPLYPEGLATLLGRAV